MPIRAMVARLAALLLLGGPPTAPSPNVVAVESAPNLGQPISGANYLLITEALRHRAMEGANLACYNVHVFEERGVRRVAFIEARDRIVESDGPDGRVPTFLPQDPACRSISFDMDRDGRVARVIRTRH